MSFLRQCLDVGEGITGAIILDCGSHTGIVKRQCDVDLRGGAGVFAAASANGVSGLLEGNVRQFGIQTLAAVIAIVHSFGLTWVPLKIVNIFVPVRVPDKIEVKGLDEGTFGEAAYTL